MTINIHNLTFQLQEKCILKNLNLDAKPGEITVLLGPNGSGKSTLLKVIAGILNPKDGCINYNGENLSALSNKLRSQYISYSAQQNDFDLTYNVFDYVSLGRYPHKGLFPLLNKEDFKIINESLQMTGLLELSKNNISQLSGGEQQRALIARALTTQSQVLLLDEPTSALDIRHSLEFFSLLKKLKDHSKTIILALHNVQDALHIGDQVALLHQGKLAVKESPRNPFLLNKIEEVFSVKATQKESFVFELP